MIRYALRCANGHSFESWFSDSASYDAQVKRSLVSCPICGDERIEKQIMSPRIRNSAVIENAVDVSAAREPASASQTQLAPAHAPSTQAPTVPVTMIEPEASFSPEARVLRDMVRAFRAHVEANTVNVGKTFAEEARKIHYGESEDRPIRGEASSDEVQDLLDEGIPIMPLPTLPDDRN